MDRTEALRASSVVTKTLQSSMLKANTINKGELEDEIKRIIALEKIKNDHKPINGKEIVI